MVQTTWNFKLFDKNKTKQNKTKQNKTKNKNGLKNKTKLNIFDEAVTPFWKSFW